MSPSTSNPTVVLHASGYDLPDDQRRLVRWTIYIGYFALAAGVAHGFAQGLSYAKIDILRFFPALRSYYQGLTAHGVANALFFTFAFSNAFLPLMTARALSRPMIKGFLQATLWTLVAANVMVIWSVTTNRASVLFTAYAPLQAHWAYYLGLVLLVVSTWIASAHLYVLLARWRRDNRGERIPLLAFISVLTYVMWDIASIGIAVSFVGFLLPWSLGILERTDPLLNRTLFWFTGHAIVYAWLLPAYISWYALVPRQTNGKLVSDPLTRVVFIMFLLLSIPTGFHHQYTDPGIATSFKAFHALLTFGVFYPSLATAFSVVAALEIGGRRNGGGGLLGWIRKLRWDDPSLTAQVLAMITFVFGGITGLINASYFVNQIVHNTAWIPGHFHMTVGSAVALTLMGVAYWAIPYLTQRKLWGRKLAVAQSWVYTVGVLIMARGLISGGLDGMPRRIFRAEANYGAESWELAGALTGIGGTLMTVGAVMFFLVIVMTIFFGKKGEGPKDIPFAETLIPASREGWDVKLDRIGLWTVAAVVLVLIAYAPFFLTYLPARLVSPGYTFF
ncbi:MAG: cbb3-type cytochrome c oxidase subunit I [Gemmatimonadota bacterium]|jgi:cytochrome c oxidase subunit 1|nr:MAG: cbb3-type cytochrome c oxidase subunit I [Gemmatimonadota bacterium]